MTLSVGEELLKEWKRVGTQTMLIGEALRHQGGPLTPEQLQEWTNLISVIDNERGTLIVKTHAVLVGGVPNE